MILVIIVQKKVPIYMKIMNYLLYLRSSHHKFHKYNKTIRNILKEILEIRIRRGKYKIRNSPIILGAKYKDKLSCCLRDEEFE